MKFRKDDLVKMKEGHELVYNGVHLTAKDYAVIIATKFKINTAMIGSKYNLRWVKPSDKRVVIEFLRTGLTLIISTESITKVPSTVPVSFLKLQARAHHESGR